MAKNKNIEFRNMSHDELKGELNTLENQMVKLRFDHAATGLDNPLVLRETRRDIARMKTELRRRELNEMSDSDKQKRAAIVNRRRRNR